jgi:glycosyltransferase involved in cell wall biosynthesis
MKILMLGWELPPHNSGGLGTACYQLCKELSNSGVDIDFVLPYDADHGIDFMNIVPAVDQTPEEFGGLLAAYDSKNFLPETNGFTSDLFSHQARYEAGVEKLIKYAEFDVIHAHDWLTFRAAIKAKQITGKPLIAHIHATEYDRSGGQGGNELVAEIEYNTMALADKIVAVSEYTKQVIVDQYKIPADKIEVVHNSIDIDSYSEPTDQNLFRYLAAMKNDGWKVIGNIGRLTIQKGLTNLLKATQMIVQKAPKTILLIVGSGDQYEELVMLSAELGIAKNVIFVEFQRGQAQRNAFEICDIFAMPSVSEPFGITPLEAIGFGVPALISNQSGVAEVIKNCLKVDYWDVKSMADQLHAAITNPALTEILKAEGNKEFQKLSWQSSARKLQQIYAKPMTGSIA